MTINLQVPSKSETLRPTITVVGVGGAGGNAVNNMIVDGLEGVNFVVANTDAQALDNALTEKAIQLGASITKGLGAGANPDIGRAAAEEAQDEISDALEGSNMVFITAGMGGGTGTGAAAVVARIAKEMGILTVGVVTKPFQFEGAHRMRLAESGLKELQEYVDTLIVIPNQNLFRITNERTTFTDAFKMADGVLHSGVRGITDLMVKPGMINLDFADVRAVMGEMGKAMMGTGEAAGERRAIEASEAAISNPLLDDVSLRGARAVLVSITHGADMTLFEVDEAMNRIRAEVDPDANIIFGSTFNDSLEGKMRVSVVATGIEQQMHISSLKTGATFEAKKPYAFTPAPKPEVVKAAPAPVRAEVAPRYQPATPPMAEAPAFAARPLPERTAAMRIERQEEETYVEQDYYEEEQAPNMKAGLREPASASTPQEVFAEASGISPRREHGPARGHSEPRGIAKFMASMGRAFTGSPRAEGAEQPTERAQMVVQKAATPEAVVVTPKMQNDDQYLDIPAFLRRQAN